MEQDGKSSGKLRVFLTAMLLLPAWIGACLAAENVELSRGQTVYVPSYSHIFYGNVDAGGRPSKLLLASMLSIRNIDPEHSIVVRGVRYYDSDGKLLRDENSARRTLGPLGSADVFVEFKDTSGGTGANFLVVWDAEVPVNPPIIESVNTYFIGTQLTAFTSRGQPIQISKNP